MAKSRGRSDVLTLEQAIVVVSIASVTVAAVIFSLDPLLHLRASRNAVRWTDLHHIAGVLRTYRNTHGGVLPPGLDQDSATVQVIGEGGMPCERAQCRGERLAQTQCWTPGLQRALALFLSPFPVDPFRGSLEDTRYAVNLDERGVIIMSACDEEPEDVEGSSLPPRIEVVW